MYGVVGAFAAAAAATIVGITAATHHSLPKPKQSCSPATRAGIAGISDPAPAARALKRGLTSFCAGDETQAVLAWRAAKRLGTDSQWGVRAQDLLHPDTPPGLPFFLPSFGRPATAAERLLARGIAFQRARRPQSAERAFRAALRLAPDSPDANVAAAVGLYDKDDPTPAFSHLGPLLRRFPHSQVVRFHLGLLSIWMRDFAQARKEFQATVADGPGTHFAAEARILLARLGKS